MIWKKLDGVCDMFGAGFGYVYTVAIIVFVGTSNVPVIDGVRGPSATLGRGLEYQYVGD